MGPEGRSAFLTSLVILVLTVIEEQLLCSTEHLVGNQALLMKRRKNKEEGRV